MPKAVPIFKNLMPLTGYFLKILLICIQMMKIPAMNRILVNFVCLLLPIRLSAQSPSPGKTHYPQHYFRDPLGIPISLAGNFGELRPNHFHMGLDIRTERREHLPVYAAGDGYISQIRIDPLGFGQAIYINHPNGYTTVYAHLREFVSRLSAYIKQEQYRQETWSITLHFPPDLFPVKKGELIAYSGSTGGSEAPHLHFEIRKTGEDINLNPLLFGLPVADQAAPSIRSLAIYDRTRSIYEQSPRIIPVRGKTPGSGVIVPELILLYSPKISLGLTAIDRQSKSSNPIGIFEASLFEEGVELARFQMDQISYLETRNVNAHMDFKTRAKGGPYIQLLFRLPGYRNSIYEPIPGDGVVDISDGLIHHLRILAKDARGNLAQVKFNVKYKPSPSGQNKEWPGKAFYPGVQDQLQSMDCLFSVCGNCLYDSVHLSISDSGSLSPDSVSQAYSVGLPFVPLEDFVTLRIRPKQELDSAGMEHIVMQRSLGNIREVKRVNWVGGWAEARFMDFGDFQLIRDREPPLIVSVGSLEGGDPGRASRLEFIVKDNLGVIRNFRAELDGKWLLFTNDKLKSFIYPFDEHCPPGPHLLKVKAEDEAGNVSVREFRFTR
jgi:murein DD-endopeptidase MepM/ murein hydrolase activator NlpD